MMLCICKKNTKITVSFTKLVIGYYLNTNNNKGEYFCKNVGGITDLILSNGFRVTERRR